MRRKRDEEYWKEEEAKEKEWEEMEIKKMDVNPYMEELEICDWLLRYC
jgi:hypothetical protein